MMEQIEPNSARQKYKGVSKKWVIAGWITTLVVVLLVIGGVPRIYRAHEALAATSLSPVNHPIVSVLRPDAGPATSNLELPGNIEPLYSAFVYARTQGYLERRFVDIGAKVRKGQLLAVISTPEVDQQLLAARATLAQSIASLQQANASLQQAKANEELALLTKSRDLPLGQQHAISQQIVDEAVQNYDARAADVAAAAANITAAEATVTANRANVGRLTQLQSFERVVAPFDGVITERNVEQGDLVTSGTAGGDKPLFAIAQSGTLRIQVDVPQSEAINIADGQKASVTVRERPGKTYIGTVARNANALDSAARTMLTEVQVDNKDGSLMPGMYAQVIFTLPGQRSAIIIPTSALVINHNGEYVVTVQAGSTIHFSPVVIGTDMGTEVEVLSGLRASDVLVNDPGDLLYEGQKVEVQ
jgi:RND family efflux transporter MFP subunit